MGGAAGMVITPDAASRSSSPGGSRRDAFSFARVAVRSPPAFVQGSVASQRPSPSASGHGNDVVVDDVVPSLVLVDDEDELLDVEVLVLDDELVVLDVRLD